MSLTQYVNHLETVIAEEADSSRKSKLAAYRSLVEQAMAEEGESKEMVAI